MNVLMICRGEELHLFWYGEATAGVVNDARYCLEVLTLVSNRAGCPDLLLLEVKGVVDAVLREGTDA